MHKKFRPSVLAIAVAALSGVSGTSFAQSGSEEASLEEILVYGVRSSLEQSLEVKRNADQIVDSITAQDIGKLPDENVSESLSRITGVQLTRGFDESPGDQTGTGQGTQISVRGIRPDMNLATVNGQAMGTTTGGRNFNFNLLSPELTARLDVYKTPAAKMDEGSVGGTVDLVTNMPLTLGKRRASITALYQASELGDLDGNKFSGIYSDVYADGKLGFLITYNQSENTLRRDRYESFGWDTKTISGETGYIPRDIRHNIRFEEQEQKAGNIALQFRPNDQWDIGFNHIAAKLDNHQYGPQSIMQITQQRTLLSGDLQDDTFIAAETAPTLTGSGEVNQNDWRRRQRLAWFDRTYETETSTTVLNADWNNDDWRISAVGGYTEGTWHQGPSLFAQFGINAFMSYDYTPGLPLLESSEGLEFESADFYKPTVMANAEKDIVDEEDFFQLDFTRNFEDSIFKSVDFGIKWRERTNTTVSKNDAASGAERNAAGVTLDDFWVGNITDFELAQEGGHPDWLPRLDTQAIYDVYSDVIGDPSIYSNKITENGSIVEEISAAYLQANFSGERYRGNFGVRYVITDQFNTGYAVDGTNWDEAYEITAARDYDDVLPSLNFLYDLSDDLVLRFGYAKVMARPTLKELAIGTSLNIGARTGSSGNPYLDPYRADSVDLSLEWYFGEGGLVSGAVFYKDVESFVTKSQELIDSPVPDITDEQFLWTTVKNGGGAEVTGLELSYQQNFTMLPGWMDGFGVVLNYTYVDSTSDIKDPDGVELPLPGLSENTANAILFWEKYGVSARVAYNYRDEFVVFSEGLSGLPVIRDEYAQVDASVVYRVPNTGLSIRLEGTNLTDEETRDYAGAAPRLQAYHVTGTRYKVGLTYRF
ncbi:MAG: TonB-dependent receptor [Pseudomonadales bacterium]